MLAILMNLLAFMIRIVKQGSGESNNNVAPVTAALRRCKGEVRLYSFQLRIERGTSLPIVLLASPTAILPVFLPSLRLVPGLCPTSIDHDLN